MNVIGSSIRQGGFRLMSTSTVRMQSSKSSAGIDSFMTPGDSPANATSASIVSDVIDAAAAEAVNSVVGTTDRSESTLATKKAPWQSPRYLANLKSGRSVFRQPPQSTGGAINNSSDNNSRSAGGAKGSFNRQRGPRPDRKPAQPRGATSAEYVELFPVAYDTRGELEFEERSQWQVQSVFEGRKLPLESTFDEDHARTFGDLDSSVRETFVRETVSVLGAQGVTVDAKKVFKDLQQDLKTKKTAVEAAKNLSEHTEGIIKSLTNNFQEVLNPGNDISVFNNGKVSHLQKGPQFRYSDLPKPDFGMTEAQGVNVEKEKFVDGWVAQRSMLRLERVGGDYSRWTSPLTTTLPDSAAGKAIFASQQGSLSTTSSSQESSRTPLSEGAQIMQSVNTLVGQNASLGLQDKRKMLNVIETSLGGL